MFCLDCGNILRGTHQLKEKALESYEKLKTGTYVKYETTQKEHDLTSESVDGQQQLNKPKRKRIRQPRMCAYCRKFSWIEQEIVF